jgi:malate dehydrogenase (oxaloacetate-decarboxylating)(NADP+)
VRGLQPLHGDGEERGRLRLAQRRRQARGAPQRAAEDVGRAGGAHGRRQALRGGAADAPEVNAYACMNGLLLPGRQVFLVDTHVNYDPTAEQIAEITIMAAEEILRFGFKPKAALLSHSNFGSSNEPSAVKMRHALALIQAQAPWLDVDGEMHGDVALDSAARTMQMPQSTLQGDANLLVCPNIDAANISYNLLKTAAGGNIAIGPVLLGAAKPVHILTASTTVRRIVNMTALTVADANAYR